MRVNVTLPADLAVPVEALAKSERRSLSATVGVLVADGLVHHGRELLAVCVECEAEVSRCDEDRCCSTCGTDLIVVADRHSADMLLDAVANARKRV